MPPARQDRDESTPSGLLLYGMYEPKGMARAPEVRITQIAAALDRQIRLEQVVGGRMGRLTAGLRWLASGGPRRVQAVYVESTTSTPLPHDLAFLALMRALGCPVGIYFRDAYQLYRHLFPRARRRQRLMDAIWRVTIHPWRWLATPQFAPSVGLARALGLRRAILLPPGTDPSLPAVGVGDEALVASIVQITARSGFDTLLEAVSLVRAERPDVRLRVVSAGSDAAIVARLPDWVDVRSGGRDELAGLLAPARVCVIPLPITPYTDLAVPVRLMDLLSFGKPIVSTASAETSRLLANTEAALLVPDAAAEMAAAIRRILDDDDLAEGLARRARAIAEDPGWTWDGRARTVIEHLLPAAGTPLRPPHPVR